MIHSTALIDPLAEIAPGTSIGPYAIIEGPVKIAANVTIGAHAQIIGDTTIGEGTRIGRAAVIGDLPQDLSFDPATHSFTIIGKNNIIREQVTIHRGSKPGSATRLGDNNFLMANCHLAHDVQAGDRNIIANAVLMAGHVHLGNSSFLGGGAVFHQFLRIGDSVVVQGNSTISKDIPHYCAANRLNRITGLNVIGLRRQGYNTAGRAAIKELFDLIFRSGRNRSQAVAAARQREWPPHCERFLAFIETSRRGICAVRAGVKGEAEGDEE
jgi:UDP-N-acetylglucosamine acyltransferase